VTTGGCHESDCADETDQDKRDARSRSPSARRQVSSHRTCEARLAMAAHVDGYRAITSARHLELTEDAMTTTEEGAEIREMIARALGWEDGHVGFETAVAG